MRWKISAHHINLSFMLSVCQKLWKSVEIWQSYGKTILDGFFWDTVYSRLVNTLYVNSDVTCITASTRDRPTDRQTPRQRQRQIAGGTSSSEWQSQVKIHNKHWTKFHPSCPISPLSSLPSILIPCSSGSLSTSVSICKSPVDTASMLVQVV